MEQFRVWVLCWNKNVRTRKHRTSKDRQPTRHHSRRCFMLDLLIRFEKSYQNFNEAHLAFKGALSQSDTLLWLWRTQMGKQRRYLVTSMFLLFVSFCLFTFYHHSHTWFLFSCWVSVTVCLGCSSDWRKYRERIFSLRQEMDTTIAAMQAANTEMNRILKQINEQGEHDAIY